MSITPRLVGLLSLLALAPAAVFVSIGGETIAAVTFVNVLIITASLAIAFSPHEGGDHATANGA